MGRLRTDFLRTTSAQLASSAISYIGIFSASTNPDFPIDVSAPPQMPSHQCPHCPSKFASVKTLATHVHYVHTSSPQPPTASQQSARGFLATVKAGRHAVDASATGIAAGDNGGGEASGTGRQAAVQTPGVGTPTAVYAPTADLDIWTDSSYRPPPPEMAGMMGTFSVTMPPAPSSTTVKNSTTSSSQDASATQPPAALAGPKTFLAVLEGTTTRMAVPYTETFPEFLERMRQASVPLARNFVAGRTTGFTAEDGKWMYVLLDAKGGKSREGELGSTLLYLAMVSEMVRAWSGWREVVVWHVRFTLWEIRFCQVRRY